MSISRGSEQKEACGSPGEWGSSHPARAKAKWTVIVYIATDNNLDAHGVATLEALKRAGASDEVNLVAQIDREGEHPATKRYLLRSGHGSSVDDDVVMVVPGETNTGDPAELADFATWAVRRFPAENYFLVISAHGKGWDDEDHWSVENLAVNRWNQQIA